ncbi:MULTISPECIES: helix-turn-helix domain-containing protein [Aeromonas]|uniref:helix-turn-helix domain-containing protein n=1 Tax=Aeromonas sp. FDAARGOS 1418 TaxID=2778067 RepID=UPI001C236A31|nr:helix-turn-helix domain-containing protein [Aeromonas sp. FDAARGOS 1418]UBS63511.1 helix-turn-helix domain-containing protein [Aeromonas caviae]
MREIDRLKTIQAIVDGHLTASIGAQRLDLSVRQIYRLVDRYKLSGPPGLRSQHIGKPSNHQLPVGVKDRAGVVGAASAASPQDPTTSLPASLLW